jgi:uncharacterized coiled-coil protein SlyX
LEQTELQNKKIAFLNEEMTKQWMNMEQIQIVTGADKFCTEKPSAPPIK